jgi:hypothetical protein
MLPKQIRMAPPDPGSRTIDTSRNATTAATETEPVMVAGIETEIASVEIEVVRGLAEKPMETRS